MPIAHARDKSGAVSVAPVSAVGYDRAFAFAFANDGRFSLADWRGDRRGLYRHIGRECLSALHNEASPTRICFIWNPSFESQARLSQKNSTTG